jgi:hypothetical protein
MVKALVGVLVVLVLAFLLNPGPEAHRDKLKKEIAARSQVAAVLRIGDLAAFASNYRTLGVASYSEVNNKVVTYGAFGIVFVPNLTEK